MAIAALLALAALAGCASKPLLPYSAEVPMAMLPLSATAIEDDRARFRRAFCQVNREVGKSLPDYWPCAEALLALVDEKPGPLSPLPAATGQWHASVVMVPGLGWECVSPYAGGSDAMACARKRGYQITMARSATTAMAARWRASRPACAGGGWPPTPCRRAGATLQALPGTGRGLAPGRVRR